MSDHFAKAHSALRTSLAPSQSVSHAFITAQKKISLKLSVFVLTKQPFWFDA
jgi:hypothetical protein